MSQSQYWWHGEGKAIASKLDGMRRSWLTYGTNPIYQTWIRNMIAYYSTILKASAWDTSLSYTGEQGELVEMSIPQARSLVRQLVAIVTKQKISFATTAETKGTDVIEAARLGNALASQMITQHDLDSKADLLLEMALVYGASWLHTPWRSDKGDIFSAERIENPKGGDDLTRILYDGENDFQVLGPLDVMYDYRMDSWDHLDWCEARTIANRWNLIAQFPEMEKELIALPSVRKQTPLWAYTSDNVEEHDTIYVYPTYHKITPALPHGRLVVHAGPGVILFDDHNPYGRIPIEPCMPEKVHGLLMGYSMLSNLLPSQEMYDHSYGAIATNQAAHAVQNVLIPRGAGISIEDVGGMNFISFTPMNAEGGGKPEALQLCKSSPETINFADKLLQNMQQISNLNSTVRGEPPAGMKAGVAIATLTANALEFLNSYSKAWAGCLERSMMHAMKNYQQFCMIPHKVSMKGRNNLSYMKEFEGKDIAAIQGVKFQLQNPLMATISGRSEVAQSLLPTGLIKNAQEYFSILEGEPVSALYETELSENDLVHDENEALIEGTQVIAMKTDDHGEHVRSHVGLMNKNSVRINNVRVEAILAHVEEHLALAANADPMLTAMVRTGKMPMPAPMPPPGAMGANPMANKTIAGPAPAPQKPANDLLGRQ